MTNSRAFVVVVLVLALVLPFQLVVGEVYAVIDAVLPDGDHWLARIAIMACLLPPFMVAYGLGVAGRFPLWALTQDPDLRIVSWPSAFAACARWFPAHPGAAGGGDPA